MKDVDFYGQILGVKNPWFVESVDLDTRTERVDIKLSHKAKEQWACPEIGDEPKKLAPMKRVAEMLTSHMDNIVTFCRHRVTNAVAEGLNSKIMAIKRRACGYRNKELFKTAIYFFCGGLSLYPGISKNRATH